MLFNASLFAFVMNGSKVVLIETERFQRIEEF